MLTIFRLTFCSLVLLSTSFAQELKLDSSRLVIVLPVENDGIKRFAAKELAKHLKLITGHEIPIKIEPAEKDVFPIYVGKSAPGDDDKLAPEEARRVIGKQGIWLWGEDKISIDRGTDEKNAVSDVRHRYRHINRTGTLFAVYRFLQDELGVRWIVPGDRGITVPKWSTYTIHAGKEKWVPRLGKRFLYNMYSIPAFKEAIEGRKDVPGWLANKPHEEIQRETDDVSIWQRRMLMGQRRMILCGHTFGYWARKHAEEHPDFLALTKDGKRKFSIHAKACVSHPDLPACFVQDWLKEREKRIPSLRNAMECGESDHHCRSWS